MSSEVETSLSIEQQNNESLRSLPLLVLSSGARSPTGVPVATALCRRVCARDASTERGGYKPLDRSCLLSSSIGRITGLAVCAATMLAMTECVTDSARASAESVLPRVCGAVPAK